MKFLRHVRSALSWGAIVLSLLVIQSVWAHNVGQVQTTKFLAPDTVQLLKSKLNGNSRGFAVGDEVSYIIQFSPVDVGASIGVAGYITDYIPPGTVVVGAAIVAKDGAGNFYNVSPSFPGAIDDGWGNRGSKDFGSPFDTHAYDKTGRCSTTLLANGSAIPAARCTARLSELHADTGIFYSTDPRTAAFPALPIRIAQGVNGYAISPTREGDLNPILNQTRATTHNRWDADQVSAFSQLPAAIIPSSTLRVSTASFVSSDGATPYNAGSAVAGLGAGYQLDNTGAVGPWNRIAYSGSRMGDNTTGPAKDASNGNPTAVSGFPTDAGYNLSSGNPLPAGTNAVRWAVGQLKVGEVRYVKITLRLTDPLPAGGLMNSSEVFGGDAAGADDGKDNVWRYHVPSVADNNSNLFVEKSVACVYDAGGVCQASNGGYIPANARVRYRISYFNSGALEQTNVVLQDILPCHTDVDASTVTSIVSGSITFPAVNPPDTLAGNCGTGVRRTVTFPTLPSLAAGVGGSIEIDVKTNTGNGDLVVNTAKLASQQLPGGVTSNANSTVAAIANLVLSKIANTQDISPGGTVSYSIVVENVGSANATGIAVYDILPSSGGANTPTMRFSYTSTASVTLSSSSTLTVPPTVSTTVPPTLAPYNALPVASNSQQVSWSFGALSLVPGARLTITFIASVGAGVPASAITYKNTSAVTYGAAGRADAASTAPVLVNSPLSVTKTIDCYFVGADCKRINASNQIPPGAKIRYQIDYANNGNTIITGAVLSDTLPCQVSAGAVSNVQIMGGPIPLPSGNPPGNAAGSCPSTRPVVSFPATSLGAGQTGTVKLDVQTNAVVGNLVVNTAGLSAPNAASASSEVQATVAAQPSLTITKTAGAAFVRPGTTVSYTITVTNVGTAVAQTLTVYDWLPTTSAVNAVATRFSYHSAVATTGLTPVTPAVNIPPSLPPYNSTTTNPYSNNQEEVKWDFGSATLGPGSSFSITFNALAGASIPTSTTTTYNNLARVYFDGNAANSGPAAASVSLIANLTIAKSNGTTTLTAGSATRYTVTVANLGPSAAGGAVVKDIAGTGLLCTAVTCAATTGTATCPAALPVGTSVNVGSTAFFTTGEAIASLPANSSVVFAVDCGVVATGL
jgi:uncharacterized repeat protein (TIGR01451 family)